VRIGDGHRATIVALKRFFLLSGFIVATALGLALVTDYAPSREDGGSVSRAHVLGLPVVAVGTSDPAWLAVGTGQGILVVGIGGVGVVTFGFYGAGILFATGQGAIGLFAIGQLAVGVVFVICQLGVGLSGIGQVLAGGLVVGQGTLGADGEPYLRRLNEDVNGLLSWSAPGEEE
jgi:hypothetical protein